MPTYRYRVILADPPWIYSYETRKSEIAGTGWHGAGERHYDTMKFDDIKQLDVAGVAADNAVLWLWCVNPLMPKAFELLLHWGFAYKGLLTWVKVTKSEPLRPAIGNGYWLRGATEHLMLGVRGNIKPKVKNQPTWFMAPLAEHSRKPAEAYSIIERFSDGPYLEMFARPQNPLFPLRDGWDVWGNEIATDCPRRTEIGLQEVV